MQPPYCRGFFFFKQKTSYEIGTGDWSSDVCSSDLGTLAAALMQIGGESAFKLMVPVLAGYIAYSIADRDRKSDV